MFRAECLICGNSKMDDIINLGSHPFADTFVPKSRLSDPDVVYPLICELCADCGQIQTKCITDPIARYSSFDYSYTSSNSEFSRAHWDEFARKVGEKINLSPGSFIVEIGSNDGYLTEQLLRKGGKTLGVDPSPYMAELAKKRGVETVVELFSMKTALEIIKKYGKADLIVANNVFNHSDSPLEFAKAVAVLLKEGGTFVSEQPYWLIGLKSRKFDQIYHEHVSYFTVKSISKLLSEAGLKISDVGVVDYHGGSLRTFAKHQSLESESEIKMIKEEMETGTFDLQTYKKLNEVIHQQRNSFLKKLHEIRSNGGSIVAVGAAAKGNTLLNFYNLSNHSIDYVTDASPHKQGKYTPLSRIPIVGDEIFADYKNKEVYALILSWNIANQLREKLHLINKNINFLVPE